MPMKPVIETRISIELYYTLAYTFIFEESRLIDSAIAQYGSGCIVPRQGTIETFVSCYSAAFSVSFSSRIRDRPTID